MLNTERRARLTLAVEEPVLFTSPPKVELVVSGWCYTCPVYDISQVEMLIYAA